MYKVVFLPNAGKFYKKLFYSDRSHFERVSLAIQSLSKDPRQGKPLRHELEGKYSLRVGVYRVIYMVEHKKIVVYILDIGHRKDIYK